MADPFTQPESSRDTLVFLIELGGLLVIVGAGIFYGLRKAFRFTDAFENERPSPPAPPPGLSGTVFPAKDARSADSPGQGPVGPTVRSSRLT
ncbi:MAG: hypothetical protein IT452_00125 [Planctomycetia bacterium]|nr:hypothetical protein [Planctomycetia bacterium]